MKKSLFNPALQNTDLASKIVAGLERVAEAFRVLLWEHAKVVGLSPIQIQILIFVAHHAEHLCNVSHLASEFNLTKPTVSDAIKMLHKKELIEKRPSPVDKRAYSIALTNEGKKMVKTTSHFAHPIYQLTENLKPKEQEILFSSLSQLIHGLNQNGILTVQRSCHNCRFYAKRGGGHYCRLMEQPLLAKEIRLDCPEYEQKS